MSRTVIDISNRNRYLEEEWLCTARLPASTLLALSALKNAVENMKRRSERGRKGGGWHSFTSDRGISCWFYILPFYSGVEWSLRYITTSFRGNYGWILGILTSREAVGRLVKACLPVFNSGQSDSLIFSLLPQKKKIISVVNKFLSSL